MKRILSTIAIFSVFGLGVFYLLPADYAVACGFRGAGGEGYGAQQRNSGRVYQNNGVSREQAVEIVTRHISRLNSDLKVGKVNDAGPLYEAEIVSGQGEEILQVIGVYKQSGQLVVIN